MPAQEEKARPVIITSVRNHRKSIGITWTDGTGNFSLDERDNPLPTFYKALEALIPHVVALCEFRSEDSKKVTATGITVRNKGANDHALIVAQKRVRKKRRVVNFSTPMLPMWPDKDNPAMDHLDEEQAKAIERVIREAKKYVLHDRAQGQIEFQDDEEEKEKPAEEGTTPFPGLTEQAATS